jgi:hypothetical protein
LSLERRVLLLLLLLLCFQANCKTCMWKPEYHAPNCSRRSVNLKQFQCPLFGISVVITIWILQPGPWSHILEVMSGAAPPDTPSDPLVMCRSSHHAVIQWDEPASNGAPITDYRLEMSMTAREQDYTTVFHGLSNSYEVRSLTAATPYYFRIQVSVSHYFWTFVHKTICNL